MGRLRSTDLDEVAKSTSTTSMKESCTFYADDGHLGFIFREYAGIERGLQNRGLVLDTLQQFGMTVNLTKSAIMLELKGQLKSMRRQVHQTLLPIDGALHHYEISIRSTHDYLGVKFSYSDTQKHTMQRRWSVSAQRFRQMLPWLKKPHQHDAEACPMDQLSPSYLPNSTLIMFQKQMKMQPRKN